MTSLVSSLLRTHRHLGLIVGFTFMGLACSSSDDGSGSSSDSAPSTGGTTSSLTAGSTGSSNSTTRGTTASTTGNVGTTTGTTGTQSASSSSTGDAGGATATGTETTGSNSVGGASSTGTTTETATSSSTGTGTTAAGGTGAGGTGGGDTEGRSPGCNTTPGISSDQYNNGQHISIMAAGKQRRYILNVPENYDNTRAYRFVIAYHQLNGNDNQTYNNDYYHLLPLSEDSTIFVAPNGQANGSPCTGMGDGESNCGWGNSNDEDIALADAVVAEIKENFCVDTNRIFATGWSYGGSMSYKTACERPLGEENGFIRAIAVYSGSQLSGNCTPTLPVAYYASHGTSDSVLCYDSMSSGCQVGNGVELYENFAEANGCTYQTPTKVTNGNHVCTELMGCMDGYPAKFCSHSGDHTPDPSDGGASWQYQDVWDFFSQF